jgi:hypothetical protein
LLRLSIYQIRIELSYCFIDDLIRAMIELIGGYEWKWKRGGNNFGRRVEKENLVVISSEIMRVWTATLN